MKKIDPATWGLDAAVARETELHPAYGPAWTKRTVTLKQLVENSNESIGWLIEQQVAIETLEEKVAALEAAATQRPFP